MLKLQRLIYLHINGKRLSSEFKIKADKITMNRKGYTMVSILYV